MFVGLQGSSASGRQVKLQQNMSASALSYITDTIVGILLSLISKRSKGEVINIGSPYEISMLDLAKKIKEMIRSKSKITFYPLPKDDPRRRRPDIRKAKEILAWEPKISLEDGLKRTIMCFRPIMS